MVQHISLSSELWMSSFSIYLSVYVWYSLWYCGCPELHHCGRHLSPTSILLCTTSRHYLDSCSLISFALQIFYLKRGGFHFCQEILPLPGKSFAAVLRKLQWVCFTLSHDCQAVPVVEIFWKLFVIPAISYLYGDFLGVGCMFLFNCWIYMVYHTSCG